MKEPSFKVCSKCSLKKSLTCFQKDKKGKYGFRADCKECCKEAKRESYQNNKESIAKYNKKYRENNKESINEKKRKSYENNKEVAAKRAKKYRDNNKESIAKKKKEWSEDNRETETKRKKEWKRNNRDKVNEYCQRRNIRKKGLTSERIDYKIIRERDHVCYLCSVPFTDEERLSTKLTQIDHKIPLSREELNPTHSYENCALVHTLCNLQKGAKTPEEYLEA